MTTQGERIYPNSEGQLTFTAPGQYGRRGDGVCMVSLPVRYPNGELVIGNLGSHEVIEEADGSLTVSPSILVQADRGDGNFSWHGYLELGIWTQV